MTVNLRRIRYFVAVADELHFGRAAKRLHMAQPPLSQQIRQLEAEVGLTLFERSTRRVTLTDAGRLFYPEAQRLLIEADSMARRVAEIRSGDGGTLRLGFVDSASYEVMPRLLRAHRQRWPSVDYELLSMSSDEQHEALIGRRIDLGIARAGGDSDLIRATGILVERLAVAVPADHRLAAQKQTSIGRLKGEPLIGFDRGVSPSMHGELHALFSANGADYDPIIEATEYTTIVGLVASGLGVAVVPAAVRSFNPPGLRYLELSDKAATSTLLMLSRATEPSPLVGRAIALAAEVFGPPAARSDG